MRKTHFPQTPLTLSISSFQVQTSIEGEGGDSTSLCKIVDIGAKKMILGTNIDYHCYHVKISLMSALFEIRTFNMPQIEITITCGRIEIQSPLRAR